jgi:hypothetical protein
VVVLLHGGVKYDEKFSWACLRSGEKQKFPESATWFFFSSGNVISHSVSNFRGGVSILVL